MTIKQLWSAIKKDAERLNSMSGASGRIGVLRGISLALRPELMAVLLYRFARYFYCRDLYGIAEFFYRLNLFVTGVAITPRSNIGSSCLIVHTCGLLVDGHIGERATIYGHCVVQPKLSKTSSSELPQIGNDVTLCLQSTVMGDLQVADKVTVAPFALLTESVTEEGAVVDRIAVHENLAK